MLKKSSEKFSFLWWIQTKKNGNLINKKQKLEETKLKTNQNFSNFYEETNCLRQNGKFHFEEDPFRKGAQNIDFILYKTLFLLKI